MNSVDVIVPCYRYGHFLRQSVESVLEQSEVDVRVLIIDDESPDDTSEVGLQLESADARVKFIRHAKNKGHIHTYNEGIEWTSAEYMLLLSADDYLLPGALSRSVRLMNAHPEVGFTFGKAILAGAGGSRGSSNIVKRGPEWRILKGLDFIKLSGSRNIVPTPTAVVRTALQKRLGGYNPELPHTGDMEMWLRLATHSSVGIVAAYQAVYRRHTENMSLAYSRGGSLPDLRQRKLALECFLRQFSCARPDAEELRSKLIFSLAGDAVGLASAAFNRAEMEISQQLCEYALDICPRVKGSLPWIRLTCKRFMGYKLWHALQPAVAKVRRAAPPGIA